MKVGMLKPVLLLLKPKIPEYFMKMNKVIFMVFRLHIMRIIVLLYILKVWLVIACCLILFEDVN